jgi:hypothetical protein
MTIDECINDYTSSARVVLTKKNVRDVVNLLLAGETITSTSRKLNISICNVSNVRNAFEDKCGLDFPNAKRNYQKNTSDSFSKIKLNNEEDILTLIEKNQSREISDIKQYIAKNLNVSTEKANKLFRKYMNEYCEPKCNIEPTKDAKGFENYVRDSKHSRETILNVIEYVELGHKRKEIAKALDLTPSELEAIIYRTRELGYLKKIKMGRPTIKIKGVV